MQALRPLRLGDLRARSFLSSCGYVAATFDRLTVSCNDTAPVKQVSGVRRWLGEGGQRFNDEDSGVKLVCSSLSDHVVC